MSEIAELKAKQDAMSDDIVEIKTSLRDIAKALNSLATLEQKHISTKEDIERIDKIVGDHETRIRNNELKLATQMWVERIVWVVVAGIISAVIVNLRG